MSALAVAERRVLAALDRLEEGLQRRVSAPAGAADAVDEERLSALRAECARLGDELARAQARERELRGVAREAGVRLDAVIGEMKEMLES